MILFQWFVVYFLNDSLQGADADYSVIPKSWLTVVDQKYFCKWPKTKKVTTNVLHKGENLSENTYNLFSVNLCFNGVPFGKYIKVLYLVRVEDFYIPIISIILIPNNYITLPL